MRKLLFILILFFTSPAWAVTYYVNKAGSNANSCAQAQTDGATAKLTIGGLTGGISCLAAGDTLSIGAGTFTENYFNLSATQVDIPAGTSAANRTKIQGGGVGVTTWATGGGLTITFKNGGDFLEFSNFTHDCSSGSNTSGCFKVFRQDGLTTDGWYIHDYKQTSACVSGWQIQPDSRDFLFEDVEIVDAGRCITGGPNGLYLEGSGITVRRAYVHLVSVAQRSSLGGIRIGGNPTDTQGGDNNLIEDSVVEKGGNSGFIIGGGGAGGSGNIVRRNICIDCLTGFQTTGIQTGTKIYNNAAYKSAGGTCGLAYWVKSNATNTELKNLINSGCTTQILDQGITTTTATNLNADPGWTDPANGDFTLTSSASTAINSGTDVGLPFNSTAPDIGPYETFSVADGLKQAGSIVLNLGMNLNDPVLPASMTAGNWTIAGGPTVDSVTSSGSTITVNYTGTCADITSVTYAGTEVTDSALISTFNNQPLFGFTNSTLDDQCGGAPSLAREQKYFRVHQVRGTEASPICIHRSDCTNSENANVSLPVGAAFRLRLKIVNPSGDPLSANYKVQYSRTPISTGTPGAYTDIPDTCGTDLICWYGTGSDPDIPAEGTSITQDELTSDHPNLSCQLVRTSAVVPTTDFAAATEVECEFVIQLSSSAIVGDTYDFRIAGLETYTVTPRVTIARSRAGSGF